MNLLFRKKNILIIISLVIYFACLTFISMVRSQSSQNLDVEDTTDHGPVNYLLQMKCSDDVMHNDDGSISLFEGTMVFGPYLNLDQGRYLVSIESDSQNPYSVVTTAMSGNVVLTENILDKDVNTFPLILDTNQTGVEFVINGKEEPFKINALWLKSVDMIPSDLPVLSKAEQPGMTMNEYIKQMSASRKESIQDTGILLSQKNDTLYGPYLSVLAGEYVLKITIDTQVHPILYVTANFGQDEIQRTKLNDGENNIYLIIKEDFEAVEFVIRSDGEDEIWIGSVCFGSL